MERAQAEEKARRRNFELGEGGATDRFWIEVERPDGSWIVEEREEPPAEEPTSRWGRRLDLLLDALPPWH